MVKIGSVTAEILQTLSLCGVGWGGGVGLGVHSYFHVQPPTIVGLRLRCSWGFDNIYCFQEGGQIAIPGVQKSFSRVVPDNQYLMSREVPGYQILLGEQKVLIRDAQ